MLSTNTPSVIRRPNSIMARSGAGGEIFPTDPYRNWPALRRLQRASEHTPDRTILSFLRTPADLVPRQSGKIYSRARSDNPLHQYTMSTIPDYKASIHVPREK